MSDNKKILIICYAFPPYPGIGGRRWAKFAKYLIRSGYEVYSIAANNPFDKESAWLSDVQGVKRKTLPLLYPKSLITFPSGLLGALLYRFSKFILKFTTKGNYFDKSIFWRKQLLESTSKVIQENNIQTVIVSAAPFMLLDHAAALKSMFPKLYLIADIRDPWTNNHTSYAFDTMSAKRLQHEKNIESKVFSSYDKVITVSDVITNGYKNMYPNTNSKFVTLNNGFDPNENASVEIPQLEMSQEKVNLVFTGSFYDKATNRFQLLLECLQKNDYQNLHFYFFGPGNRNLKNLVPKELTKKFTFGSFDKISQVNGLINQADYAMLFLTDDINYSLSTKFCEYIKLKKKILVFSKPGFTGVYVEENQIGYQIHENNMDAVLEKLNSQGKDDKFFPESFDVSAFSLEILSNQLLQILQNQTKPTLTHA